MNLPTLEEQLRKIAESKLDHDIGEVSANFRNFLASQKELFRTSMQLVMMDGDTKFYPWLTDLFNTEYVVRKIKEYNLAKYIQEEIDSIIK